MIIVVRVDLGTVRTSPLSVMNVQNPVVLRSESLLPGVGSVAREDLLS